MQETWYELQLDTGNKHSMLCKSVVVISCLVLDHNLMDNRLVRNGDVSKAEKLGVDLASLASSLTKKKEEPTT